MERPGLFEIPPAALAGAHLAEVVSVDDPQGMARVQVRLLSYDGVADQDGAVWARVAVPFAGADRGAFFIPDVGDEVLVVLLQGDPRLPMVIGGLWNGRDRAPEQIGDRVDRWSITGKAGTRIAIVEAAAGSPEVEIETPGGARCHITDAGGGKITIEAAGNTVTLDSGGVTIKTGMKVSVQATSVNVSAGTVKVDAAMSTFSGIVKCDVLQATTVIAQTYTPGAGNIW